MPFTIDARTGTVNISRPLDISEAEQWQLTVEANDGLWKSVVSDLLLKLMIIVYQ